MAPVRDRVVAASAGRDRVVDAVKALALALVVLGHSLAWTATPEGITTTLDVVPWGFWLTWVLQILPLFFLMAGRGLPGLVGADTYRRRVARLAGPALLLLLVTLGLVAAVTPGLEPDVAAAVGLLPVQLVWFLGVYLLVVALAPLIVRIRAPLAFGAWIGAIAVVDVLRINVAEVLGWANLILVWGLFAALGVHLARLRSAPRWLLVLGAAVGLGSAAALVALGPYSAALISTASTPGLTNLAPPTLVLACVGLAQVCVLLLAWPALDRLLARDGLWVVVALFALRAMELYLWHMLAFTLAIGGVYALGWAPPVMGLAWWLLHLAVLVVVVTVVLAAAPVLTRVSTGLAAGLGRLAPAGIVRGRAPAIALAVVAAVPLLLISESGLADPLVWRSVIGIPYAPWLAVLVLAGAVGLAQALPATRSVTDR